MSFGMLIGTRAGHLSQIFVRLFLVWDVTASKSIRKIKIRRLAFLHQLAE